MNNKIKSFCQKLTWLFTFISLKLFSSFKVTGRQNLQNLPQPLLIISNHRSFWDPLVIGTLFPFSSSYLPIGFMVADVYYNSPLRLIFWLTNTHPTHKGEGLEVSLAAPKQILKAGGTFAIFPAGKRQHLGRRRKPRRGAAALALEIPNLIILPVYLKTVSNWNFKDFLFKKREVGVVVGQPFKLVQKTSSQNIDEVAEILNDEIFKLG